MKKRILKTLLVALFMLAFYIPIQSKAGTEIGAISTDNPSICHEFTLNREDSFYAGFFEVDDDADNVQITIENLSGGDTSVNAIVSSLTEDGHINKEIKEITLKKGDKSITVNLGDYKKGDKFFIEFNNVVFPENGVLKLDVSIYSEELTAINEPEVSDYDLPAPSGLSVPSKTIDDSIYISWDPITWPNLKSGDSFSSRLDGIGYMVFYGQNPDNLQYKWVSSDRNETDRCGTFISELENGTYYVIVCAGTKRFSRIGDISYTYTPGKESEVKTVTVNLIDPNFIISGVSYDKGGSYSESLKVGKKKIIKITSNTEMKLTVEPLNSLAKTKEYCKIKNGKTAKISFTKNAAKGKYYFEVTGPSSSKKLIAVTVYENSQWEISDYILSKNVVKSGKKTTINVSTYLDNKVVLEPYNDLAKNSKYVKVKNGKTGKITFSKEAKKGTYEFKVNLPYTVWYNSYTIFTIEVKD